MRTRHPFPDIEDTAPETVAFPYDPPQYAGPESYPENATFQGLKLRTATDAYELTAVKAFMAQQAVMHQGENRLTRRIAVAEFDMPVQPGLRRMLLKQRQRQRRGKMDVELNRLRRRKANEK